MLSCKFYLLAYSILLDLAGADGRLQDGMVVRWGTGCRSRPEIGQGLCHCGLHPQAIAAKACRSIGFKDLLTSHGRIPGQAREDKKGLSFWTEPALDKPTMTKEKITLFPCA